MFSLAGSPVTVAPNNKNMINLAIKDGKVIFYFHVMFVFMLVVSSLNDLPGVSISSEQLFK